jgi:predicted O-methyltransferase YrrM
MGKFYDYIDGFKLKNEFGIKNFVETGTAHGLQFLDYMRFEFENYYSCEINKEQYNIAVKNVGHLKNLHLNNQSSTDFLTNLLPSIKDIPTVFWLDAHFPGSELGLPLSYEKDKKIRIPLEDEIDLICKLKNVKNDIIICDDLRIYEDGNYGAGNWNERENLGHDNINFIYKNFYKTHNIIKNYEVSGCVMVIPRKITYYNSNPSNQTFINLINNIIKNNNIEEIIETGTFTGVGSTKTFAETNLPVKTIECNIDNYNTAKVNLAQYKNVEVINALSLNRENMIDFIKKDSFLTNKEYLNECQILTDHNDPINFYDKELNLVNGLENILFDLINNDKKQIIFLDSAGGVGYLEFLEVMKLNKEFLKNKHILLDDVMHVKHFRSYEYLIQNDIPFKFLDNRVLYFNI